MSQNLEGKKLPEVTFKIYQDGTWVSPTTSELFDNKTIVLFGLPGAFTPACSISHLPRYNQLADTFKRYGVDDVLVVSVNDTFVMNAWKKAEKADKVTFIPDGNGEFSQALGLLSPKTAIGLGDRSRRYSMLVKNGVVEKFFIEEDDHDVTVSGADAMLAYIAPNHQEQIATLFTKTDCPYCAKAKQLLTDHHIQYDEIVIGKNATADSLKAVSGRTTVPQVFINGKHIGGSDDLEKYLADNTC
ncbi:glutathione peroxidase [Mergibacter septicus]|uniref:Glutathione peroxidase n=1 Tax=Mergibacter septicus TaxID=221402 RepID=A0A8E3SD73_9PAST|nr:glutathione peroxidase [Mergibacter septicus]AWX15828.1 glutathione peroxidase [Mergibacter septicus]QDJ15081.1 glutathione peroxidase [Mergibacter septicus]UTU47495.1 glutathione peroxidase [Mergibacter septicus]WMR95324.1 glutathione peroxidase [Mergibacter septicus]